MTDVVYRDEFLDWDKTLDKTTSLKVHREILKLADGKGLGTQRGLQGIEGVSEIKIKKPPIRIYYRLGDDGMIEILYGGKRDDQKGDLKHVRRML